MLTAGPSVPGPGGPSVLTGCTHAQAHMCVRADGGAGGGWGGLSPFFFCLPSILCPLAMAELASGLQLGRVPGGSLPHDAFVSGYVGRAEAFGSHLVVRWPSTASTALAA